MQPDLTEFNIFPPTAITRVKRSELLAALAIACDEDCEEIEIVHFAEEPQPWFSFNVGGRRLALWRHTGKVYECDELGAAGEDPIPVPALPRPDYIGHRPCDEHPGWCELWESYDGGENWRFAGLERKG